MNRKYKPRELHKMFRGYAKANGWNAHPRLIAQWIELWLQTGHGPVKDAIQHEETHCPPRPRLSGLAAGCALLGISAACVFYLL